MVGSRQRIGGRVAGGGRPGKIEKGEERARRGGSSTLALRTTKLRHPVALQGRGVLDFKAEKLAIGQ